MTTALVLAGHGSHISPQTAGLVWQHVDGLRAWGIADEVTATFWKETPSFHQVFDALTATDITVIPLFTAQGYFTQTVIPAEMGLIGPVTMRDGRTIRYTRTLNEHSYLTRIVRQRIHDALRIVARPLDETAVAIIGHSTRRNPESRKATEMQATRIRNTEPVAEVVAVYLDDSPGIAEVYALTSAPNLIAVPYFLTLGSHTTLDVPEKLSLAPGQTTGSVKGRSVYYTPPVGIEESLREVILELAHDAGMPIREATPGSVWDSFPSVGRDDLIQAVHAAGALPFGQLVLTPTEVRPATDDSPGDVLDSPAALRTRVREQQTFRPLATSADLPGGWRVPIHDPIMLHAVVETVYPGAVADWAAHRRRVFAAGTLESTAARQTGMYRPLDQMSMIQRSNVVSQVCKQCVRHPTWFHGESPLGAIPCAEPCNMWMTRALELIR